LDVDLGFDVQAAFSSAEEAQRESETPLTLTWTIVQTCVTGRSEQKTGHG